MKYRPVVESYYAPASFRFPAAMSTLVVGRRCPSTASPLYGQHPILSLPSALRAPTLFSLAPAVLIGSCHRWKPVVTNARRLDAASDDERWVTFDGEEEWDRQVRPIWQGCVSGPSQCLSELTIVLPHVGICDAAIGTISAARISCCGYCD